MVILCNMYYNNRTSESTSSVSGDTGGRLYMCESHPADELMNNR